jgi:hypothetical protein
LYARRQASESRIEETLGFATSFAPRRLSPEDCAAKALIEAVE